MSRITLFELLKVMNWEEDNIVEYDYNGITLEDVKDYESGQIVWVSSDYTYDDDDKLIASTILTTDKMANLEISEVVIDGHFIKISLW